MKKVLGLLLWGIFFSELKAQTEPQPGETAVSKVDPRWANEMGQYFAGVCSPYGMVKLGPDNPNPVYLSGYKPGNGIRGFSHTHANTHKVEASFGHILVIPQLGEPNFRHIQYDRVEDEKLNPARYSAKLFQKKGFLTVVLTANQNSGRHQWKFHPNDNQTETKASIIIDPIYCLALSPKTALKSKFFQVENDGSFSGKSTFSADNQSITIFYSGQVNLKNAQVKWRTDTTKLPGKKIKLDSTAFAFTGNVREGEEIEMSLCLSFKNESEARESLGRVLGQNFQEIQKKAEMAWEDRLSVVQVGNPQLARILSTALYRTMVSPTDVSGNHPEDQFGEAHFWDQTNFHEMSLSIMPLHNLLFVPHQRRFFNSLIRTGESKNGLPEAWISGYYGKNEGGASAERILAEGVQKGIITGLDAGKAWKVCLKNAMEASPQPEWYGRSLVYLDQGFETAKTEQSMTRSIQLASCDYDLAQMAKKLEKVNEAKKLSDRSFKIITQFKPTEKWFWPSALASPHLLDTIAVLSGGKAAFLKVLDSLSVLSAFQNDAQLPFHLARAFFKAGQREKAERVLEKFREMGAQENSFFGHQFDPACGGMANLIFAHLGLLPIPGTDQYFYFKHASEKIELTISGGKTLIVKGKGKKPFWNGKEIKIPHLRHSDLANGGTLEWR